MNSEEMEIFGAEDYDESDADTCESDDSQADPNFELIEETQSSFSSLRIKKKSKSSAVKEMNENVEEDLDGVEAIMPEFDEKDQKSYETVQKIIEDGMINKLKVDQCKVYLRKHGLRLTGNKETLKQRIKEHLQIVNGGGGEKKYPASSFVLNCKGDACAGDIVMFEQNVYEMFSIASRSATGPPCGTRLVAGRIVKESYGAAKQQHTFTIEVLWSKGEKPLPPLHPLLIKGRNLYRLRTLRQRWEDEGERQKILSEKHTRGSMARLDREARIQEKEMRKMHKSNRVARTGDQNKPKKGGESSYSLPMKQPEKKQEKKNAATSEPDCCPKTCIPQQQGSLLGKPNNPSTGYTPAERLHQRQPLTVLNCSFPNGNLQCNDFESSMNPIGNANYQQIPTPILVPGAMNSVQIHAYRTQENFNATRNSVLGQGPVKIQTCRFFAQGICWYGDRCKYLHVQSGGK